MPTPPTGSISDPRNNVREPLSIFPRYITLSNTIRLPSSTLPVPAEHCFVDLGGGRMAIANSVRICPNEDYLVAYHTEGIGIVKVEPTQVIGVGDQVTMGPTGRAITSTTGSGIGVSMDSSTGSSTGPNPHFVRVALSSGSFIAVASPVAAPDPIYHINANNTIGTGAITGLTNLGTGTFTTTVQGFILISFDPTNSQAAIDLFSPNWMSISPALSLNEFTMVFSVNVRGDTFLLANNATNRQVRAAFNPPSPASPFFGDNAFITFDGANTAGSQDPSTVNLSEWAVLSIRKVGNMAEFYENGVLVHTEAIGPLVLNTIGNLVNSAFNANFGLGEYMVWDSALTQDQHDTIVAQQLATYINPLGGGGGGTTTTN